jgi:hypothetical protein
MATLKYHQRIGLVRLNNDQPLFAFAGIWTEFKGDRGTKWKPVTPPFLWVFEAASVRARGSLSLKARSWCPTPRHDRFLVPAER